MHYTFYCLMFLEYTLEFTLEMIFKNTVKYTSFIDIPSLLKIVYIWRFWLNANFISIKGSLISCHLFERPEFSWRAFERISKLFFLVQLVGGKRTIVLKLTLKCLFKEIIVIDCNYYNPDFSLKMNFRDSYWFKKNIEINR